MQPQVSTLNRRSLPRPKTIACDVDGTLKIRSGEPDPDILEWLKARHAEGYILTLWSMRGADYAREFAEGCGIANLFSAIIGKPGYVVDDQGWTWTKWTQVVRLCEWEDAPDVG